MEFRLLGQFEVRVDDAPIDLGPFRRRSLLALLVIHRGRVLSTDQIMDSLWGESVAATKQNALWVHVSRLRSVLEPNRPRRSEGTYLLTRPPGYMLDLHGASVDIDAFERAASEAEQLADSDPGAASIGFGEALAMWRGRALEDFSYEAFAEEEIRRLEELRLHVVESRIDADLARGLAVELIGEIEGLVRANPLRERFTGQLMTAFTRAGRRPDAELAFQRLCRSLDEELGLEPSAAVVQLRHDLASEDGRRPVASATTDGSLFVRGYELREQVAQNELFVTHRAFQPAVGREVVVRRIRAERADQPDFIRRFESQATTIAALEHPHVLPLYDFWREPGAAYLVTRHIRGQTLADRLLEGPLAGELAERLVEQIGGALSAAHRQGIGHDDLGPETVIVDDDDNFFLDSFRLSNGAPVEDVIAEDDAAFAALVDQCTDLGSASPVVSVEDVRNPYKGLRAFTQSDAPDFFGRERLVERLVGRLGRVGSAGRFIVVVGPSGSGKSSVVRAGLLPALRSGAIAGSSDWFVTTMTPGRHPFEQLADALESVADASISSVYGRLCSSVTGISDAIASVLPDDATRLVLLIDQFEELFVQVDKETREQFVDGVVRAVDDRSGRLAVVATMRADFYDRPLQHPRLGELFRIGTEVVTPMTSDELARAVSEPAGSAGVAVESSLVARVVADVSDQPAALPLLQFALTELFDARTMDTITLDAYNELGGVAGALVTRADQVVALLPPENHDTVRQVLLRLVHVGPSAREDTRRRVLVSELESLGSPRKVQAVLDAFGRHRLLTFDRDPMSRTPTVEIAHEAMLHEWGLFRRLIEDNRHGLRLLETLSTTAASWDEQGRDPSELYRGTRLDTTLHWIRASGTRLSPLEQAFIEESARTERDLLEVERERVAQRDRQNRRLRRLLAAVGAAAMISIVLGLLALQQQRRAEDERYAGETRRLAADGPGIVETNRRVGLLLAAEAYRRDPNPNTLGALQKVLVRTEGLLGYVGSGTTYRSASWAGDGSLIVGMRDDGLDVFDFDTFEPVGSVEVPNTGVVAVGSGSLFAATSHSRRIEVIDLRRLEVLQTVDHDEQVISMAFGPDATTLAVGDADGDLRLVDVGDGGDRWRVAAHPERVFDEDAFPPGVEPPGAHEPRSFPLGVRGIDFSDDGTVIGTSGSGFIRTWSAADGSKRLETTSFRPSFLREEDVFGSPEEIALLGDGTQAIVHNSRHVQRWNLRAGTVEDHPVVLSDTGPATADLISVAAAFGPTLAIITELDQAQIVDLDTDELRPAFNLQAASVDANIAISPDETTLVSAGADGIVVWALDGRELLGRSIAFVNELRGGITISGDGHYISMNDAPGPNVLRGVGLFDVRNDPVDIPLEAGVSRVLLSAPGLAILQDGAGNLSVRSLEDLDTEIANLGALNYYAFGTLAPDGGLFAFGTGEPDQPLIHLFDPDDFERPRPPVDAFVGLGASEVSSVSFSPDGSHLAAATLDGMALVFDTSTWEPIDPPLAFGAGFVVSVEYSPDGRFLATSDVQGRITLRDPETFQPIGAPLIGSTGGGRLAATQAMAFTEDSRYLVTTVDGNGRLFDIEARVQIGGGFPSSVGVNTSPTDSADRLPIAQDDRIMIYDLDIDSWFDIACRAAGRNFTIDEWEQFGAAGDAPPQTCPQWPAPTEGPA